MFHSPGHWIRHFAPLFIEELEVFHECLARRVLPGFENLDAELRDYQQSEYERLGRLPAYRNVDHADLCAWVYEDSLDRHVLIEQIGQGIINLFAVGLYHMLEQQVITLCRRKLISRDARPPQSFADARKVLLAHGLRISQLPCWTVIDELRLVTNTVKHADGHSAVVLKLQRPELFYHPKYGSVEEVRFSRPVFQPLVGNDLYVTKSEFDRYVAAAISFWYEFEHMAASAEESP